MGKNKDFFFYSAEERKGSTKGMGVFRVQGKALRQKCRFAKVAQRPETEPFQVSGRRELGRSLFNMLLGVLQ